MGAAAIACTQLVDHSKCTDETVAKERVRAQKIATHGSVDSGNGKVSLLPGGEQIGGSLGSTAKPAATHASVAPPPGSQSGVPAGYTAAPVLHAACGAVPVQLPATGVGLLMTQAPRSGSSRPTLAGSSSPGSPPLPLPPPLVKPARSQFAVAGPPVGPPPLQVPTPQQLRSSSTRAAYVSQQPPAPLPPPTSSQHTTGPPPPSMPAALVAPALSASGQSAPAAAAGLRDGASRGLALAPAPIPAQPPAPRPVVSNADILTLNVGGERVVQRRRSTLCAVKGSFLTARFSGAAKAGLGWRYRGDDNFVLAIRAGPSMDAAKSGNTLAPGDTFLVSEERRGADGILYLKLADGRGWVFERKPGVGVLCEAVKESDMDREGRHFINYSPALFLPFLDYLGMKELEVRGHPVQPPQAPEHLKAEFEAMLRDFGILPSMGMGQRCLLVAMHVSYLTVPWWAYGLAFEVHAKQRPVLVTALETCAVWSEDNEDNEADGDEGLVPRPGLPCTVHVAEGPLKDRLGQRAAWAEVGRGILAHRTGSRIVLTNTVLIRPSVAHCFYIATSPLTTGNLPVTRGGSGDPNDIGISSMRAGVAFGAPMTEGISAQDGEVALRTGHFSTSFEDFSNGGWYPFIGHIEYNLPVANV